MANGDTAASVGMDVVPGSADINNGFDEINKTRDYLANDKLNGTRRADQITSGTLKVARGGTGRTAPFSNASTSQPRPSARRLLFVDVENTIFSSNATLHPTYIGYYVHFTTLLGVDFDDGQAVEPHGAPFTPTEVIVQGLLTAGGGIVVCTARADNEPANSENVFLRAHNVAGPYDGTLSKVVVLCLRGA
ncbi:hypothetical protein [Jiangella alba]|uniref:Uncharacterized protein n=1 Tax=Jiangella alba TaxID=561176 RepID=A0A1H5PJG6_9ACTN|nr:hypothetical protein [Jiangella alba]SEF13814.1 hypothetical protein SAMN04488561_4482 [Jiangella alba]